jgi:4-hydroxy-3-polyprenylbenzoate decarboxylase
VEEVHIPLMSYHNFCLIRVGEGITQEEVKKIGEEALKVGGGSKYTVLVDSDISPRDMDLLIWALSFRTQPGEDFLFLSGGSGGLDPSAAPTGSGEGKLRSAEGMDFKRVVINATRKWPYPPVALPRKKYMDRALEIWQGHSDLPAPRMKEPWYGYELGYWDERLAGYAALIAQGEYRKVGEEMVQLQRKLKAESKEIR